jgi:outer membrane protein assembly factor BamA
MIIACLPYVAYAGADSSHVYGQTVAEIRIMGLSRTKPFIVERELTTKVGEPFTIENERSDYESLDRLQIFSSIQIYTARADEGGVVVFVEVKETFAYLPVVSISISDENGISIGGGLKSVNLLGQAIYFSGVARFGGETTVELDLRDPWVTGNHLGYVAEYYYRNRDNVIHGFYETAHEAYMFVRSYVRKNGRFGARLFYHGIQSDRDGRTLSSDNVDHVLYLNLLAGFDTRDLLSNPSRGWWSGVDLTRSGILGTDSDFWRANLDLRRFQRLSHDHVLALFSLYTATTGKVGEEVAYWQTYGLGGSNSIRGYGVGTSIGKNQWINTVEYRWNFMQPRSFTVAGLTASLGMQLAFFTDFGSAWNTREEFKPNFLVGGGAGLRFIVPYVGLVRFDVGLGDSDPYVYFHIGTREKAERQRERVR